MVMDKTAETQKAGQGRGSNHVGGPYCEKW